MPVKPSVVQSFKSSPFELYFDWLILVYLFDEAFWSYTACFSRLHVWQSRAMEELNSHILVYMIVCMGYRFVALFFFNEPKLNFFVQRILQFSAVFLLVWFHFSQCTDSQICCLNNSRLSNLRRSKRAIMKRYLTSNHNDYIRVVNDIWALNHHWSAWVKGW